MQHECILAHLAAIVESIEADLMLPLRVHEQESRGGFLSISRQVFCYVDHLGALSANGENSTKNAVAYMERYFARANPTYAGKCNLIYSMWRHGTVHEYEPKVFVSAASGFRLRWGANRSSKPHNREWHLKCVCGCTEPGCYYLFINLFELVDELKESIAYFAADLKLDEDYLDKVRRSLRKASAEFDLDKKQKPDLLSEASGVVAAAAGVIDDLGEVVRKFEDVAELERFKADEWSK
jgi:hypothetical protein